MSTLLNPEESQQTNLMGRKNGLCDGIMTVLGNGCSDMWLTCIIATEAGMEITQIDGRIKSLMITGCENLSCT
jgi:predicted Rossmann fold nucleotide-binding protein DprA/Smf involved in DNA uptake